VRYQGDTDDLISTLLASGVERFVFSTYAHRPGLAESLNAWSADLARRHPASVPLATFHPADDVARLAPIAFSELGLAGMKVHCQVQQCFPDDPGLWPAYRVAERLGKVVLIHSGPAPERSPFADHRRLERALRRFPDLRFVVAHLGADRFDEYFELMDRYDQLYLDTTMVFAGFFDWQPPLSGLVAFQDRVLYGSDFPNLPYPVDQGIAGLQALQLGPNIEDKILYSNAARLFGPSPEHPGD
jgi:predicted TIM-barrel fold metal-dependent hydrolase